MLEGKAFPPLRQGGLRATMGQLEEASRELLVILCSSSHCPHPDQDPQRQDCKTHIRSGCSSVQIMPQSEGKNHKKVLGQVR